MVTLILEEESTVTPMELAHWIETDNGSELFFCGASIATVYKATASQPKWVILTKWVDWSCNDNGSDMFEDEKSAKSACMRALNLPRHWVHPDAKE